MSGRTIGVVVFCPTERHVDEVEPTLRSVADQGAAVVEVVIVADRAVEPGLRRLRPPGGLSVSISGTMPETSADYVCLMRAGGLLVTGALAALMAEIESEPTTELLYTDDGRCPSGEVSATIISDPRLRPGFSPERLLAQMYLGEFTMVAGSVIRRAMESSLAIRTGCRWDAPLPHVTALVLTRHARRIAHLPDALYLRSPIAPDPADGQPDSDEADELNHYLELVGVNAVVGTHEERPPTVHGSSAPTVMTIEPRLRNRPPVSIIIPTIGVSATVDDRSIRLVDQAVSSICRLTEYPNYEIVLVAGQRRPAALADGLRQRFAGSNLTVITDDRPFNFSHACNLGATASTGDYLAFVNDDTKVLDPKWLDRLMLYAMAPEIGAVGARLLYPDRTIQHAGIWTRGGHPEHRYDGYQQGDAGYLDALLVPQNVLAVTAACLVVGRHKFDHVGGFSPIFPSSYNDVDLCLKLGDVGWRTVVVPEPAMIHYESASRDPSISDEEMALLHDRWRSRLNGDLYDNPNHRARRSEELPAPWIVIRSGESHPARSWPLESLTTSQLQLDELAVRREAKRSGQTQEGSWP